MESNALSNSAVKQFHPWCKQQCDITPRFYYQWQDLAETFSAIGKQTVLKIENAENATSDIGVNATHLLLQASTVFCRATG